MSGEGAAPNDRAADIGRYTPSAPVARRATFWAWLLSGAQRVMSREPDFVIGEPSRPYLRRWWIIPRNRFFNVYLHEILRSDDDRALHDHPWINVSILLAGRYVEHVIAAGGIEHAGVREAGSIKFRRSIAAHRLEIEPGQRALSLFITGPRIRRWGFHCPKAGWVHWKTFCATDDKGQIGRGCGEQQ